MKRITILIFIMFITSAVTTLQSAPAAGGLRTEILPDGTPIYYYVKGDEKFRYYLSTDGYVMMKNESGFFYYAQKDSNDYLIIGNILAHNEGERNQQELNFLKTTSTFLSYHPDQIKNFLLPYKKAENVIKIGNKKLLSAEVAALPPQPTKNLVILVNFSNNSFVVSDTQTSFFNLLNQEGYNANQATGSVRDYFTQSSGGAYIPNFDVVGPYTLPNNISYYGANSGVDDMRPQQMFIDACQLADDNGLDFTQYDTDNDGTVDNVFIIYAGNNEAETSIDSLVWPHSWSLDDKNTKFDGKSIYLYSCTSELRGSGKTAANICGIGTFCHEYSHLLGLPDLYHTTNSSVFCLDEWDVMDGGLYSNYGKTPTAYSSYERYYLGWLTPEILDQSASKTLQNLNDSNKAFIVAASSPNLNGFSPSPKEFFLIENRQKIGFDAYLPYHGMLVWHIDYDQTAWDNNAPNNSITNNSTSHQRVYLQPADNIHTSATKAQDAFPGISNITSFFPTLWDGTSLNKAFINISETSEIISFDFFSSFNKETPIVATAATELKDNSFIANWNPVLFSESYCLILYKDTKISSPYLVKLDETFSNISTPVDLEITDFDSNGLTGWTGQYVYHGASAEPDMIETKNALRVGSSFVPGNITTPAIDLSAYNGIAAIEFDLRIWNSTNEQTTIEIQYAPNGVDFETIDTISGSKTSFEQKTLQVSGLTAIGKIRFAGTTVANRFFIDNINIYQGEESGYIVQSDSIETYCDIQTNSYSLTGLDSNQDYSYVVVATDGTDFTPYSNKISVTTNALGTLDLNSNNIKIYSKNKILYISGIEEKTELDIFQIDGKLILKKDLQNFYNEIPLNKSGIFVLKLKSANRISSFKLLVY